MMLNVCIVCHKSFNGRENRGSSRCWHRVCSPCKLGNDENQQRDVCRICAYPGHLPYFQGPDHKRLHDRFDLASMVPVDQCTVCHNVMEMEHLLSFPLCDHQMCKEHLLDVTDDRCPACGVESMVPYLGEWGKREREKRTRNISPILDGRNMSPIVDEAAYLSTDTAMEMLSTILGPAQERKALRLLTDTNDECVQCEEIFERYTLYEGDRCWHSCCQDCSVAICILDKCKICDKVGSKRGYTMDQLHVHDRFDKTSNAYVCGCCNASLDPREDECVAFAKCKHLVCGRHLRGYDGDDQHKDYCLACGITSITVMHHNKGGRGKKRAHKQWEEKEEDVAPEEPQEKKEKKEEEEKLLTFQEFKEFRGREPDDWTCPVCLSPYDHLQCMPMRFTVAAIRPYTPYNDADRGEQEGCGHVVCERCAMQMLEKHTPCPLCRSFFIASAPDLDLLNKIYTYRENGGYMYMSGQYNEIVLQQEPLQETIRKLRETNDPLKKENEELKKFRDKHVASEREATDAKRELGLIQHEITKLNQSCTDQRALIKKLQGEQTATNSINALLFGDLIKSRIASVSYGLTDPSNMGLSIKEADDGSQVVYVKLLSTTLDEEKKLRTKVVTVTHGKPATKVTKEDEAAYAFIKRHSANGSEVSSVEEQAPEDLSLLTRDIRPSGTPGGCVWLRVGSWMDRLLKTKDVSTAHLFDSSPIGQEDSHALFRPVTQGAVDMATRQCISIVERRRRLAVELEEIKEMRKKTLEQLVELFSRCDFGNTEASTTGKCAWCLEVFFKAPLMNVDGEPRTIECETCGQYHCVKCSSNNEIHGCVGNGARGAYGNAVGSDNAAFLAHRYIQLRHHFLTRLFGEGSDNTEDSDDTFLRFLHDLSFVCGFLPMKASHIVIENARTTLQVGVAEQKLDKAVSNLLRTLVPKGSKGAIPLVKERATREKKTHGPTIEQIHKELLRVLHGETYQSNFNLTPGQATIYRESFDEPTFDHCLGILGVLQIELQNRNEDSRPYAQTFINQHVEMVYRLMMDSNDYRAVQRVLHLRKTHEDLCRRVTTYHQRSRDSVVKEFIESYTHKDGRLWAPTLHNCAEILSSGYCIDTFSRESYAQGNISSFGANRSAKVYERAFHLQMDSIDRGDVIPEYKNILDAMAKRQQPPAAPEPSSATRSEFLSLVYTFMMKLCSTEAPRLSSDDGSALTWEPIPSNPEDPLPPGQLPNWAKEFIERNQQPTQQRGQTVPEATMNHLRNAYRNTHFPADSKIYYRTGNQGPERIATSTLDRINGRHIVGGGGLSERDQELNEFLGVQTPVPSPNRPIYNFGVRSNRRVGSNLQRQQQTMQLQQHYMEQQEAAERATQSIEDVFDVE